MICKDCKAREYRVRGLNECPVCKTSFKAMDNCMCSECADKYKVCEGCGIDLQVSDMSSLKSLAKELLDMYKDSEEICISEFSMNRNKCMKRLKLDYEKYLKQINQY